MTTDHEVERIARLIRAEFVKHFAATEPGREYPEWESISEQSKGAYRHVARRVIDDPGRRM